VALALVAKKFKNRCDNEQKIIRYLQNRGFSGKAVRAVLEDFVSLTDD
jgi:recX family